MKNNNIKTMSLSELSFIVLTDNYSSDIKNMAHSEIKKRFLNNGCHYDAFMEYEEEAIDKRGNNIENYLIQVNPTAQLLMELYLTKVYKHETTQHGNLLFSENLLCNSNSQKSFFVKALKIELDNIKKRIEAENNSDEDIEKLNLIYEVLNSRYQKKQDIWYENSLTDCVMDTVTQSSSLMSDKRIANLEKYTENWKNGSKLAIIQCILYGIPLNIAILDYLNMKKIANQDLSKLYHQQKSIIKSLKNEQYVNYSFIDTESLINQKQKIKNIPRSLNIWFDK